MARGKKRDTRTSQEKLTDLIAEIEAQEAVLKNLKQQKADLEKIIEAEKKEEIFKKIQASGKTIDEILESLK